MENKKELKVSELATHHKIYEDQVRFRVKQTAEILRISEDVALDWWHKMSCPEPPSDPAPQGGDVRSSELQPGCPRCNHWEGIHRDGRCFYHKPATDPKEILVYCDCAPVSGDLTARAENFFHANSDYGSLDPRMFQMMADFHESERMVARPEGPIGGEMMEFPFALPVKYDPESFRVIDDNGVLISDCHSVGGSEDEDDDAGRFTAAAINAYGQQARTDESQQAKAETVKNLASFPPTADIAKIEQWAIDLGNNTLELLELVQSETQSLLQERDRMAVELKEAREQIRTAEMLILSGSHGRNNQAAYVAYLDKYHPVAKHPVESEGVDT